MKEKQGKDINVKSDLPLINKEVVNISTTLEESPENKVTIKDTGRGRGKFKPAPDLNKEEVKQILLDKIGEETSLIIEDEEDEKLISSVDYKNDKYNVVGLFSGCGGLDLGFELAGLAAVIGEDAAMEAFRDKEKYEKERSKSIFHTIYTNDMFKEANQTYKKNFPSHIIQHQKDIRKVAHFPLCDVMLGGFPCPGFSEAGPRLVDDERNFLYIHYIRALLQTQPNFFVAENVKGMMTLGKGEVLKQIVEDFSSAGYDVTPYLVNSRDFGVPQLRERVFLVGVHKEKVINRTKFKYPTPQATHGEGLLPFVTLKDAIGDLKDNPGPYFTGSYSTIYLSRNRKKTWEDQSFTIQASGRQAPLHPGGEPMRKLGKDAWELVGGEEQNRRLSVKEIARIQTFPDWFKFSDGGNQKVSENNRLDKIYKQIGNAVPVLLAKAIAQPIANYAYEQLQKQEKREKELVQTSLF
ncbi:DNA (cytosine-5-)-methyltransferase [Bacillus toyonensis]|uniref:DNA cytosine methyltransferase n=1 Tax=Bacillus toyonensis TaxID=155322 RepID=UPI000BFC6112|nr:DNA cytosine methyltransferase [Bacillus toyonensis]PHD65769.1 DNA (cytosine-5-)-methyltransferase [Bacillus toyonensis]